MLTISDDVACQIVMPLNSLPFDPTLLPDLIEQGYVVSQVHPTLPLRIYNYGAKTQYDRFWNAATLSCRGLVLDADYQPIARPLQKFFNVEEHQGPLPDGMPVIYEKMDGSMILLFHYADEWQVASRGSFMSEQAVKAKALLSNYSEELAALDRHYTYILEIIYPTNRIVVDYGTQERLVMLAAIHTLTGAELVLERINWNDRAKTYPADDLQAWMKTIQKTQSELVNQEGFILKWPNGFRLKYKLADYVRLHRVLTRIQAKDIWECLCEGQNLDQFLESVPDEFYQWVKGVKADLDHQFQAIEADCKLRFAASGQSPEQMRADRKATAAYFQSQPHTKVLFLMLDDRDYRQAIWKLVKPEFQRPFRSDNEG
jgi:RNA ligase